jgi:hypothetical protein
MFGGIAARCGRRAERTPTCSDRADRLRPNIVFSNRDSYQRRGHVTVCKVASYRLTMPRTGIMNMLCSLTYYDKVPKAINFRALAQKNQLKILELS